MILTKKHRFLFLYLLISFIFISSCTTVPITGRKRIALLPASNLATMAMQSYQALLGKSILSTNQAQIAIVRKVGIRIAIAAESFMREEGLEKYLKNFKWEFNLIEDNNIINAFCMPGGKVAV